MLAQLRRKFIIINMILVCSVLLGTLIFLYMSSYDRFKRDSDKFLEGLVRGQGRQKSSKMNFQHKGDFKVTFFVLDVNENQDIIAIDQQGFNVNKKLMNEAIQNIKGTKKTSGIIGNSNLKYLMEKRSYGYRVAFTDISRDKEYLMEFFLKSVIIFIAASLVLLIISVFLSGFALGPIKIAWKKQQRFVADASHELKTPLTVMLTTSSILLSEEESLDKEQRKWIMNIKEEAARMEKLVQDLLFLAKSDECQQKVDKRKILLGDVLEQCILLFEPIAFESGRSLESEIQEGIEILGHEDQIKQLIMILMDNAIKHSDLSSKIRVKLSLHSGKARLTVNNTGAYIKKDEIQNIFDRFYRADEARSRGPQNSYGLGLSIAKEIVLSHRGKIDVKSSEEEGTTFYVQLPILMN